MLTYEMDCDFISCNSLNLSFKYTTVSQQYFDILYPETFFFKGLSVHATFAKTHLQNHV